MLEDEGDVCGRLGLGLGDADPHQLERLAANRRRLFVGQHAEASEIALVATDALVLPLLTGALLVDVERRIVGGRVGATR